MLIVVSGTSVPKKYSHTSVLNWTKLKDWWCHTRRKAHWAGSEGENGDLSRLKHDDSNDPMGHPVGRI